MSDVTIAGADYSEVSKVAIPLTTATATATYATYVEEGVKAGAIPFGTVDSSSTSTAFTATVDGITELVDGACIMLKNGVVTSASGFTLNVNNLGALPVYSNLAAATRETTIFNVNYTMLFIYDSTRVSGGAWICYRGYDSNTDVVGYQLRTANSTRPAHDKGYRYRLWFSSADGGSWVPANTSTSTNATTRRTANTTPIDPFGPIIYSSHNTSYSAGTNLNASYLWQQNACALGYSFTDSLSLTAYDPVYVKCTPRTDGSALMQGTTQALPTTADGYIYIFLGLAYNATNIELQAHHPVYWHDGTGIRLWTGAEPSAGGSSVSVTQTLTSGTEIGSITVDDTTTTLYAPASSGGGVNKVTLYTDDSTLYTDVSRTTTFIESCGYDYNVARDALENADVIEVFKYYNSNQMVRYLATYINFDSIDETYQLGYMLKNGTMKAIDI